MSNFEENELIQQISKVLCAVSVEAVLAVSDSGSVEEKADRMQESNFRRTRFLFQLAKEHFNKSQPNNMADDKPEPKAYSIGIFCGDETFEDLGAQVDDEYILMRPTPENREMAIKLLRAGAKKNPNHPQQDEKTDRTTH